MAGVPLAGEMTGALPEKQGQDINHQHYGVGFELHKPTQCRHWTHTHVRNALMTLDFVFTIMHYVIYHFMVMLSSCNSVSCHPFDFCMLQVIINFLAASAG